MIVKITTTTKCKGKNRWKKSPIQKKLMITELLRLYFVLELAAASDATTANQNRYLKHTSDRDSIRIQKLKDRKRRTHTNTNIQLLIRPLFYSFKAVIVVGVIPIVNNV